MFYFRFIFITESQLLQTWKHKAKKKEEVNVEHRSTVLFAKTEIKKSKESETLWSNDFVSLWIVLHLQLLSFEHLEYVPYAHQQRSQKP